MWVLTMPKRVSLIYFKSKFGNILQRVTAGESFTITKRGKSIADVVPSRSINHTKTQVTIDSIMAAKKHIVSDQCLAGYRCEGRR